MVSHAKKSPANGGAVLDAAKLLRHGLGCDHIDVDAAILLPTGSGVFVSNRVFLALAFCVDAVGLDALADQIRLHRFSAAQRQTVIQRSASSAVRMTGDY